LKAAVLVAVDFGLKRKWRENNFEVQCADQGKPIKDAISKLWTVPVVKCTDQGKPIKESISNLDQRKPIKEAISKLWTVPVNQRR
jgi:ribosomal protein L23